MTIVKNHGLKCKSCDLRYDLEIEQWSNNLYLGKCTNPLHSMGVWLTIKWIPGYGWRWRQTQVHTPRTPQRMSLREKTQYDKLQVPFWRMMGQKAKPRDVAYEKALNHKGWSYGDAALARNQNAENPSGYNQFKQAVENKNYGQETKYQRG